MSNDNQKCELVKHANKNINSTSQSCKDTKLVILQGLKKSPVPYSDKRATKKIPKRKNESTSLTQWDHLMRCLCDSLCEMSCKYGCDWGNCCEATLLCHCSNCNFL